MSIDSINSSVNESCTRQAEENRSASQANTQNNVQQEAAAPQSQSSVNDGSAISDQAQGVMSTGFDTAQEAKSSTTAEGYVSPSLRECSQDIKEMGLQMVDDEICSADELIILQGENNGNEILVSSADDNGISVSMHGKTYNFTEDEAKRLIIAGGKGNDIIRVDADVTADLHLVGGSGNDSIEGGSGNDVISGGSGDNTLAGGAGSDKITAGNGKDTIYGGINQYMIGLKRNPTDVPDGDDIIDAGGGRDYIEGGIGNDRINAGTGDDVVYGGAGEDTIDGGWGDDYIDGGKGNDTITGGTGADIIFGGRGNDKIDGGSGDDRIYGGKGKDTVTGGWGADQITAGTSEENSDTITDKSSRDTVTNLEPMDVPDNISVTTDNAASGLSFDPNNTGMTGADNFVDRTQDDLDAMASMQIGQDYFNDIAATGRHITIHQYAMDNGGCAPVDMNGAYLQEDGTHSTGSDSNVYYNPSNLDTYNNMSWSQTPPSVILAHEMSHAWNNAHGSLDHNHNVVESAKTGLFGSKTVSSNPVYGCEMQAVGRDVEGIEANPEYATENGWREAFGIKERSSYTNLENSTAQIQE